MNYYLGIEFIGNQLKIAAFRKSRQYFELVKLDSINLLSDQNEAVKEISNWITRFLPDPTNLKAVLTVSESTLYIKELKFPKMPPEKLNEAVYWEIPAVAPIPQADAVYDWQIMSEEKGTQNVLVIVAKGNLIQNIISLLRNAQIDIVAIEPSSYAFARVANAPFDTNTLVCLVQEHGTDFIILKNGVPFFTTSVTGNTQSETVSHIKSGTDLTNEIYSEGKKIIDYWEKKEALKIYQVVVSGDLVYKYFGLSASLNLFPPITTYIGTIKKISSLKFNEYSEIDLVSYLISLGAGLRHQQKDVLVGINLFPPVEKQKNEKVRSQKKAASQLLTFVIANVSVLIILAVAILSFNLWWYSLEKELVKLNNQISTKSANVFIEEVNATNQEIQNVLALTKSQDDTGLRLKIIASLTPQTVKLTKISLLKTKTQEWTIEGIGDRGSILAFHKILETNANSAVVSMPYSNFDKPSDVEFSINIIW
jgi:cell division protein FtsL